MPEPQFLPQFTDAADIAGSVFAALARGVAEPRHPFHWCTLATLDPAGVPRQRTVIIRSLDAEERVIVFHTDARSLKVRQLRANPRVGLHFYDAEARLQLVVPAWVSLNHQDDEAATDWHALRPSGRAQYAVTHAPGSMLLPDEPPEAPGPVDAGDASAYANFVRVACRFDEVEVLELLDGGNRRARLNWELGTVTLTRLAP